jgi:hypothetical protein
MGARRSAAGSGIAMHDRTQRIDVTEHAASALMKCAANGIDLSQPAE